MPPDIRNETDPKSDPAGASARIFALWEQAIWAIAGDQITPAQRQLVQSKLEQAGELADQIAGFAEHLAHPNRFR